MLAPATPLRNPVLRSAPACAATDAEIAGMASLVRAAYEGRDLSGLFSTLSLRIAANPFDAAALFDLSILLQAVGQRDKGLEIQSLALEICRRYTRVHGDGSGLRVLVIATHGDLMANTPIDFLLETSDARQHLIFIDAENAGFDDLPEHDVAFFAIGESPENAALLARVDPVMRQWPGPILNNAPSRISALTRDGVSALFDGASHVLAPRTARLSRAEARAISIGALALADRLPASRSR